MRESIFNYHFTLNNKKYIFNTNNSGLLEQNPTGFTDEENFYLIENNFLVDDALDESAELEKEINQNIKNGTDDLQLTIALTNQCNFKCIYCSQDKNEKMMTKETACDILSKIEKILTIRKYQSVHIHYFGGEPLMNIPVLLYLDGHLKEICALHEVPYRSHITTNGSLLNDEILEKVGFHSIQLTFDGMEQTHNHFRVSDSFHFQEELDLIRRVLVKTQASVVFRMNICRQNRADALKLHRYIIETFGSERIKIAPNPMVRFHKNDPFDMLTPNEFADTLFQIRQLMDVLTGEFDLPTPKPLPCGFPYGNAYAINPDGSCGFCSSFQNGKTKFSDVDISAKRELKFRTECRTCKCLPLCLGGCPAQTEQDTECCIPEKYRMQDIIAHYIARMQPA